MTTKKSGTKKPKSIPAKSSGRVITTKPLRIENQPSNIAQTKSPQDLIDQETARKFHRAITDLTSRKFRLAIADLASMLLATTEAIEHYIDGERKNDPIVRAHAEIAKKSRALINKLAKAKAA
jgi:hypothetical protein